MQNRFETFTVLIAKINRNIKKITNLEVADFELRSPHISLIYHLFCAPGLTATDLCERSDGDKATVSRSLDYLESRGYLKCESKFQKRYKSPLFLTEKGKEVGSEISERIERILEEIGKVLTEEERLAFYRSLQSISEGLEGITRRLYKRRDI